MAIGARITSENLSGKTATVTFVPYTGQTSGTTVNLGTKTIPFNNITSHPYGDYSLYFAEYDFTYTLNIPEPVMGGIQMFVATDKMIGSDNYGAAILNFNDFTAEVIDLDVDSNIWANRDVYFSNESGFMYYFRGISNTNERLVIFTDSSNTEIERYSGTTSNFDRGMIGDKWTYFEFGDLGILKYSDGTSVYTYTWNALTHQIDIEYNNNDGQASDGTIIIKKNIISECNYDCDGESYIVNPEDGTTTLFKTFADSTYIRSEMSLSSNFIVVETRSQGSSDIYTNFEICDTSGGVLESVSLTGDTYTNSYMQFHGTNKFTVVYYNGSDNGIDYKIIHYNGNTQTLIQGSHVRGNDYDSVDISGSSDYYPSSSNLNKGGVVIMFYNYLGNNSFGTEVTHCDIVYMFDNQSSFSTYTFANNETKYIQTWGQLSDIFRTLVDNGNGVLSCLTIMSDSVRIENTGVSTSDINQVDNRGLNNKSILQILINSGESVIYNYINHLGVITDSVTDTLFSQYETNVSREGEVAYIRMNTLNNGDLGFYVYSGSSEIIPTDFYSYTTDISNFYTENGEVPDAIFLFGSNGEFGRVLSSTGISSQFSVPISDNFTVSTGKDKFMFVYVDDSDNLVKINLYNFSGTLLNSETTTFTSWSDTWGVKDRFVVKLYNGDLDTDTFYLVSEETITSVTLANQDSESNLNDYIWWYD